MKAISQPSVAARELRDYASAPLARSRSRALHCLSSLSLSCLCLTSSRLAARRLGARPPRGPNNSLSSFLASSRRSFERYATLTQDSSQRSPSESSPSHSTSTSRGRPRRPSCRRTAIMRRTAHRPPSSASWPATTGPMATRCRTSRLERCTSCLRRFPRCGSHLGSISIRTGSPTSIDSCPLYVWQEGASSGP